LFGPFSYPYILLVEFNIVIVTTNLWESNYSENQRELFELISDFKHDILTPIGYRNISKILNQRNILTPNGCEFTPPHVFGIYKKGVLRKERVNRTDLIQITTPTIETFNSINGLIQRIIEQRE